MNTLAIMQPYFFPYIGFWQLIRAADRFVILDDVNYINRGWVNRNRILVNGVPTFVTVPLAHASQNKHICDIGLQPENYWRIRLVRSIEITYRRAPYFEEVFPLIARLIAHEADGLAGYLAHQLEELSAFLGIETEWVPSSRRYGNGHLTGQQRILDICIREQASTYVNLPGGQSLYDAMTFQQSGIALRFLKPMPISYRQRAAEFVPNLSLIDVLMENGRSGTQELLGAYQLVEGGQSEGLAAAVG
jgi:hypothetical protein